MRRIIMVLLLGGALLAACGNEAANDVAEAPTVSEPTISDGLPLADDVTPAPLAVGPGISVADAMTSTLSEPLLINGYVFVYTDGSVVLTELIAESFPPQAAPRSTKRAVTWAVGRPMVIQRRRSGYGCRPR